MVRLAVASEPALSVDAREIDREGETYTVDTLTQMRDELGDQVSLNLVMGMDSFRGLHTWHQWEALPKLANILVTERPGSTVPLQGVMANFLGARKARNLHELMTSANGRVWVQQLALLDISATAIRGMVARGESPRYLLPDSVWDYIKQHRLYRPIEQ
jgi:nicotinate-nucleotide adenylyltransferase